METCSNCERQIGNLEPVFLVRNSIVCSQCYRQLEPAVIAYASATAPATSATSSNSSGPNFLAVVLISLYRSMRLPALRYSVLALLALCLFLAWFNKENSARPLVITSPPPTPANDAAAIPLPAATPIKVSALKPSPFVGEWHPLNSPNDHQSYEFTDDGRFLARVGPNRIVTIESTYKIDTTHDPAWVDFDGNVGIIRINSAGLLDMIFVFGGYEDERPKKFTERASEDRAKDVDWVFQRGPYP